MKIFFFPLSFLNGNFIDEATEYSIREIHCKNSKNTKKQETPRNQKTKNSKGDIPKYKISTLCLLTLTFTREFVIVFVSFLNVRGEDSSLFSALPWKITFCLAWKSPTWNPLIPICNYFTHLTSPHPTSQIHVCMERRSYNKVDGNIEVTGLVFGKLFN